MTSGRQAVPSCPPDLLVVGLHLFRGPVVDDFADVGLVNAHAKSHGGDNTLEEKQKHVKQVSITCNGIVFMPSLWWKTCKPMMRDANHDAKEIMDPNPLTMLTSYKAKGICNINVTL